MAGSPDLAPTAERVTVHLAVQQASQRGARGTFLLPPEQQPVAEGSLRV